MIIKSLTIIWFIEAETAAEHRKAWVESSAVSRQSPEICNTVQMQRVWPFVLWTSVFAAQNSFIELGGLQLCWDIYFFYWVFSFPFLSGLRTYVLKIRWKGSSFYFFILYNRLLYSSMKQEDKMLMFHTLTGNTANKSIQVKPVTAAILFMSEYVNKWWSCSIYIFINYDKHFVDRP